MGIQYNDKPEIMECPACKEISYTLISTTDGRDEFECSKCHSYGTFAAMTDLRQTIYDIAMLAAGIPKK